MRTGLAYAFDIVLWRSEAVCQPDLIPYWLPRQAFFATGKRSVRVDGVRIDGTRLIAAARAVCSECPGQYGCFRHGVVQREVDGIWGGAPYELVRAWQDRDVDEVEALVAVAYLTETPIQDAAQEALECSSSTAPATARSSSPTPTPRPTRSEPVLLSPPMAV